MTQLNDLEARLRAELRAEAGRVTPGMLRPLAEPAASASRAGQRAADTAVGRWYPPGARKRRVLAALAVAVAVLAVVAGVSLAGLGGRPRLAVNAAFPRYYVTLEVQARPSRLTVVVHDSASGHVLDTKRLPLGFGLGPVIATADDREFILAVPQPVSNDTRLLRLQVGAGGRSLRISALPLPPFRYGQVVSGLAISPDRRQLAVLTFHYDFVRNNTGGAELEVTSMTSRQQRLWSTPHIGLGARPAWVGASRLAFTWEPAFWPGPAKDRAGVRLLDLAAPGSDLLAARFVLPAMLTLPGDTSPGLVESAVMSADGRAILAAVTSGVPHVHGGTITGTIVSIRPGARPGFTVLKVTRSHYRDPLQYKKLQLSCEVMSVTPALRNALVSCWQFGRLDGRTFTRLPGAGISPEGAW